jgi:hypothetical protein
MVNESRPSRAAPEALSLLDAVPRSGDLVLARVTRLGQHKFLQCTAGRHQNLFVGDEIIAAYGHRCAPDQYEALVPQTLEPCQLVAGGGVVAAVHNCHEVPAKPNRLGVDESPDIVSLRLQLGF